MYKGTMTNTTEVKLSKGDKVRSRYGEFNGTAWVVTIQSDGMIVVELSNRARMHVHISGVKKAEG